MRALGKRTSKWFLRKRAMAGSKIILKSYFRRMKQVTVSLTGGKKGCEHRNTEVNSGFLINQ